MSRSITLASETTAGRRFPTHSEYVAFPDRPQAPAPPSGQPWKVLSIRQPFASLIVSGRKPCENRTWSTPYRGRLFIHASRIEPPPPQKYLDGLWPDERESLVSCWNDVKALQCGAILGSVELVEIVSCSLLGALEWESTLPPKRERKLAAEFGVSEQLVRDCHSWLASIGFLTWRTHCDGPLVWIFRDPRPLDRPVPAPGKLNLWTFASAG